MSNKEVYVLDFPSGYPRITVNPSLKSVEKGHNAIMKCEAAADPDPSILWLKDHVPVDMSDPRITLLDTGTCRRLSVTHDNTDLTGCLKAVLTGLFTPTENNSF